MKGLILTLLLSFSFLGCLEEAPTPVEPTGYSIGVSYPEYPTVCVQPPESPSTNVFVNSAFTATDGVLDLYEMPMSLSEVSLVEEDGYSKLFFTADETWTIWREAWGWAANGETWTFSSCVHIEDINGGSLSSILETTSTDYTSVYYVDGELVSSDAVLSKGTYFIENVCTFISTDHSYWELGVGIGGGIEGGQTVGFSKVQIEHGDRASAWILTSGTVLSPATRL